MPSDLLQTPRRSKRFSVVASPPSSGKKARHSSAQSTTETPSTKRTTSVATPGKVDLVTRRIQEFSPASLKPLLKKSTSSLSTLFTPSTIKSSPPKSLPSQYSVLYEQFSVLEEVVGLFRSRNQTPWLRDIALNVERVTGRRFNLARLQQLLAVAGDFYKVSWREERLGSGVWEPVIQQILSTSPPPIDAGNKTRTKAVWDVLWKRVQDAEALHATKPNSAAPFDAELHCPLIEPVALPTKPAATPRGAAGKSSESPLRTPVRPSIPRLSLSASPHAAVHLPILSGPLTPRDKSLTPRQQLDQMKERIRSRQSVDAEEVRKYRAEHEREVKSEEFDALIALVSHISKRFYTAGLSSIALDLLVKELQTKAVAATEKLVQRLAEEEGVVDGKKWLSISESTFKKGNFLVRLNKDVVVADVVKNIKLAKAAFVAAGEGGDVFHTPRGESPDRPARKGA